MERKNSKVEVQENVQEITEDNENKQGQVEEQGAQEILVEQGHENEQQQKTYHVCSFPEDDEILVKKAEMERYNEEEKELLMRVARDQISSRENSTQSKIQYYMLLAMLLLRWWVTKTRR